MIARVGEAYAELAHYTSAAGLKGILESQTLWASHARFLNDSREIEYFFDVRCEKLIEDAICTAYRKGKVELFGNDGRGNKLTPEQEAKLVAQELTSSVRTTTMEFNQPYLLSFCGTNEPRNARDGLLSQWRAYGSDGGYALIFDTKRLEERLAEEVDHYYYQHMQIGNVYYYHEGADTSDAEEEIREAENDLRNGVLRFYKDPHPDNLKDFYISVTTLCCLFKHWGFHEEHEIRVVAIPAHESLYNEADSDTPLKPRKPAHSFMRDGYLVPYIELLGGGDNKRGNHLLPIKEILVGPHRDAVRRRDALSHYLDEASIECPVFISTIPFVGAAN